MCGSMGLKTCYSFWVKGSKDKFCVAFWVAPAILFAIFVIDNHLKAGQSSAMIRYDLAPEFRLCG